MSKKIDVTSTYTGAEMWRVPAGPLTMSLREYYAGMAMLGIEASGYGKDLTPAYVADMATERADALIAALQGAGE